MQRNVWIYTDESETEDAYPFLNFGQNLFHSRLHVYTLRTFLFIFILEPNVVCINFGETFAALLSLANHGDGWTKTHQAVVDLIEHTRGSSRRSSYSTAARYRKFASAHLVQHHLQLFSLLFCLLSGFLFLLNVSPETSFTLVSPFAKSCPIPFHILNKIFGLFLACLQHFDKSTQRVCLSGISSLLLRKLAVKILYFCKRLCQLVSLGGVRSL
ncbi:hypothetical protein GGU10DRAFT_176853 [Lentinula aff. detonsa]|uniref:Uncharacterized protein n=1 Tax=Lentinula aff. detonsa TaxID=2804958 RepID=A0AA38NMC9_9AGAR|nr:hypothetical protein GGU10DRAFT_176853 [Lentinula aff. detonsa]